MSAVTKESVLRVLKGEIGTTDGGTNRTPYGRWYGMDGVPWCAIFQCWGENEAGGLLMPKTAYTPTMAQFFIDKRRWSKEPRVGALGFHNFPDSLDRIQHVSRVLEVIDSDTVRTIEGNTSSGTSGSQDNGDGVHPRIRNVSSSDIVGFGYPLYEEDLPRFVVPEHRRWFGRGDKGADVRRWQRHLNAWMRALRAAKKDRLSFDFGKIEVSGSFDGETVKATLTFQARYELDDDARVGRHTIEKMERTLEHLRVRSA